MMDVVIDLRVESETFGQHETYILDSKNSETLFIPNGFGHGYQVLSDFTTMEYALQTNFKFNEEYVLNPYDKTLAISWQGENHILSTKDKGGMDFKSYFEPN
jgi:dTDP-4-dehydrorhamnose 3,5-epimerase